METEGGGTGSGLTQRWPNLRMCRNLLSALLKWSRAVRLITPGHGQLPGELPTSKRRPLAPSAQYAACDRERGDRMTAAAA